MQELDAHYLTILRYGLIALRNATCAGDWEYCRVETEHLHELPSLIGDPNLLRHRFYLDGTRQLYLDWIRAAPRTEDQTFAFNRYQEPWAEMERILGPSGIPGCPCN